jgi:hypothetical protein
MHADRIMDAACEFISLPEDSQLHQRDAGASIALGFQQIEPAVYRVADCGLGCESPGDSIAGPPDQHDRVPGFALQPIDWSWLYGVSAQAEWTGASFRLISLALFLRAASERLFL